MRLDLHIHTTASDGVWRPERVVRGALEGGLDVIAIADHDTTSAVIPASQAAEGEPLEVIPAVELSSSRDGSEIHVLGYFVGLESPVLQAHQTRARSLRVERMDGMVGRLREQGMEVTMDAVLEAAGPSRFMLGRPHLARALVAMGYVGTVSEAFDRYIGDQHDAFIPAALASPEEAVEVVLEAGGLPVWAHPPRHLLDDFLPPLIDAGLRGLEAIRPGWRAPDMDRLKELSRRHHLLVTGGSDFHDPERNDPLGSFHVTGDEVSAFLDEGGM